MAYGIILKSNIAATNVDSYNRTAKAAADFENGSVFELLTRSAVDGEGQVWVATAPSGLTNLWMAATPEWVDVINGVQVYRNIDVDPANFINKAGQMIAAFKPQLGDIITLSADAVGGTKGANGFVVATASEKKLQWAAAAVTGLSLKLIDTTYISKGNGTLGSAQRVTAYKFEVVAL